MNGEGTIAVSSRLCRSPLSAVDDLAHRLSTPLERGRALVGHPMTDADGADGGVGLGDPELLAEGGEALGRNPEEAGPEALVDHRLEHEQDGHTRVDVPVGDRPAPLV